MKRFYQITHVDQIRKAIEGFEDLIKIYERDDMLIANYVHNVPSIFEAEDGVITEAVSLRRECRGLVFYAESGLLMSRPFQKFPNLNEWKEAHIDVLDFSGNLETMDKADGSMIRPLFTKGKYRLGTKMGVTDTSEQCEGWLNGQEDSARKWNWVKTMFDIGFTPIFEWTSPENRIVLRYEEPQMILTALRNNMSGLYVDIKKIRNVPFNKIETFDFDLARNPKEFVEEARKKTGIEGYIIRFPDGGMVKLKTDEYVDIHRTKDEMRSNRHIANLVFQEKMDDVYSMLDEQDQAEVRAYVESLTFAIVEKIKKIERHYLYAKTNYETRKDVATKYVPESGLEKMDIKIFYSALDGRDIETLVKAELEKKTGSDVNWSIAEEWLGIGA